MIHADSCIGFNMPSDVDKRLLINGGGGQWSSASSHGDGGNQQTEKAENSKVNVGIQW